METAMTIQELVTATDILMFVTAFSIWWTVCSARKQGPSSVVLALPLLAALLWGLVWTFHPALSVTRFLPPPQGQGGAIVGVIATLTILSTFPAARKLFNTIDSLRLVDLGLWRVVYGTALLLIGLQSGLPSEFFWSAAFGDIFVGMWAFAIVVRHPNVKRGEVVAWNVVGLLDLAHVLALGAIYLPPFYTANPTIAPLNLLPLVGVPLLLVLHVNTLAAHYRMSRKTSGVLPA
jgi:hypothetical protein